MFKVKKGRGKDAVDLSIRFSASQAKWVGSVVGGVRAGSSQPKQGIVQPK
jgi:hypothetical protein